MVSIFDKMIILAFLGLTIWLGLRARGRETPASSATAFVLGGRALTLPSFVATTVSTWYGGILGVGEYGYRYGISSWIVFGVPYYVAAILFAFFLAKRARRGGHLTLPQQLSGQYGRRVGRLSALVVLLTGLPAAYLLMTGTLVGYVFDIPDKIAIVAAGVLTAAMLYKRGFSAVVRTDKLQIIFMFGGFMLLLAVLFFRYGLGPLGGGSPRYFEPTARRGLLVSVLFWLFFDAMTTTASLYAVALLPSLSVPALAFPTLAVVVLPVGLVGLFFVGLFSTILSTLDSQVFVSASVFGIDLVEGRDAVRQTRYGVLFVSLASIAIALSSESIVDIWHTLGSLSGAILLLPTILSHVRAHQPTPRATLIMMVASALITGGSMLTKMLTGSYWLALQPIFLGFLVQGIVYLFSRLMVAGERT